MLRRLSHKLCKYSPHTTSTRSGSKMFPELQRGAYSRLEDKDRRLLEGILGPKGIKTEDLSHYNNDWLGTVCGFSELVVCPSSVEEVSAILKYCNKRRLAVVPQGGNTGLVGGSNPVFDEIVLSMERMNKITNINPDAGVIECEAGVILHNIGEAAAEYGYTVPLDLGSRGSCVIGGNLATHAGGLRVVRYGQLRGSVLGMRVVLPNGKILDSMTNMRKDNTGYDIKQLFIGSEGTLGVITDVSLLLPQAPASVNVALFGCDSFSNVVECYKSARCHLGEIVSACEFMDGLCMKAVNENLLLASPLDDHYPFYFIVETSGMSQEHDMEKMEHYVERVFEEGLAVDGVLASSRDQASHMMSLRENVGPALKPLGFNYKYDVSLPITHMYSLVEKSTVQLSSVPNSLTLGYGHIGDNNLHLNIVTPHHSTEVGARIADISDAQCCGFGHIGDNDLHVNPITPAFDFNALALIEPFIYEEVAALRGSVSAEHGMGLKKANFLKYSKDEGIIDTMRLLKHTFDPNGIMNPYKLLPW